MAVTNNSLKEYYVKMLSMYNNIVNMVSAMNQSLSSSSSEISVTLTNADNTVSTLRIPSMLYLETKLEQLQNNFNNLFEMPASGEAWFQNNADMYKLQMVKSGVAPVTPKVDFSNVYAGITDNNFLKDLVSPKTYLRLNLKNLPNNVDKVIMKKFVFHSADVFNLIKKSGLSSYEEYVAALYNLSNGSDYTEYENTIDLPMRNNRYVSEFRIEEIPTLESGNPWEDGTSGNERLSYKVRLNTLQYHNVDDTSIEYTLKPGDYISIADELAIYKVKTVNTSDMTVIMEEHVGHFSLMTYAENSQMVLTLYESDFSDFEYVNIPLEENQYITVFIGYVDNNVRSEWSAPYIADLSDIYMYDKYGNKILDRNGVHMNYMEYYSEYCTNIGDLILGISQVAYPQLSNFTNKELSLLQTSTGVQGYVTKSITGGKILNVVPINKHLIETTSTEEIINLHAQKADLSSQLTTMQENIDNVYNTLISTDFSQEVTITQESLRSQLQDYYTQRLELQKQLNAVIDNIAAASADVTVAKAGTKYRVRGITEVNDLENYIHDIAGQTATIIAMDVEYKYKSPTKDTTSVMNINGNVFTDWVKQPVIERQRKLVFNSSLSSFSVEFEDYGQTQNIIKWNQIDIPIVQGEDVVLRVRYKYNIGTPYIDLYTPWSDEMTMVFPTEMADTSEVATILEQNEHDVVSAKFSQTLINDGYQEHVNNSLTVNNTTFYHMPENIYSGFTTSENNLISLKDKLHSMSADLDIVKSAVSSETNKKYKIYLAYDDKTVEIFNNTVNKISIYNTDHISDSFVKKQMNLIIKNVGDVNVKFYSIFPGNIDIPLLLSNNEFYGEHIIHYERVPMIVDNKLDAQYLGQWIYFRQDNPYTGRVIYYDNEAQNIQDVKAINGSAKNLMFNSTNAYMIKDFNQVLLGYRKRTNGDIEVIDVKWMGLNWKGNGTFETITKETQDTTESLNRIYSNADLNFFKYDVSSMSNNYLVRFEDICGINKKGNVVYLDDETSIAEFVASNNVNGMSTSTGTFMGAFLYPDIEGRSTVLTKGGPNDFMEIEVGKSVSIPVTFEYYVDGEEITEITKGLYFDIRDSLVQDPQHFMIEMTAHYDYTSTGNLIATTSLQDEASDY